MKGCINCEYGNKTSRLIAQMCSECGYGMDYKFWKSKEKSSMKLIYKSPMTEREQLKTLEQLMKQSENPKTIMTDKYYLDKAMEICRNDTKGVEGLELTLPDDIAEFNNQHEMHLKLTLDQMKEIVELYNSIQDPQER